MLGSGGWGLSHRMALSLNVCLAKRRLPQISYWIVILRWHTVTWSRPYECSGDAATTSLQLATSNDLADGSEQTHDTKSIKMETHATLFFFVGLFSGAPRQIDSIQATRDIQVTHRYNAPSVHRTPHLGKYLLVSDDFACSKSTQILHSHHQVICSFPLLYKNANEALNVVAHAKDVLAN